MKVMKSIVKLTLLSVLVFVLSCFSFTYLKPEAAEAVVIKIDLSLGEIRLGDTCYGHVTNIAELEGIVTFTEHSTAAKGYTWTHNNDYQYYVYQSTNESITHNVFADAFDQASFKEVREFAAKWDEIAIEKGYQKTTNRLIIQGQGSSSNQKVVNVILHNVWTSINSHTSIQAHGAIAVASDRANSSIPASTYLTTNLYLKGHNRASRIAFNNTNDYTHLYFRDYEGDSEVGTMTVVGEFGEVENCGLSGATISGDKIKHPSNHWDSAIGADDSAGDSENLRFASGIVYAGTAPEDNCTAIGAGGNGYGTVYVTGGTVYAIASSTGTAIGGGIGHQSHGGGCSVNISGGSVYAYNFGQEYAVTHPMLVNNTYKVPGFVPGTAIGGGSSISSSGNSSDAKINISGGYVEAFSAGGAAIGGGNSITNYGGSATINISGGVVKASSDDVPEYGMPAGVGIGGGSSTGSTSGKDYGGKATVNITGGNITSTGIGGGTSKNGNGGDATVTVSGGTMDSDAIGGGLSEKKGYAKGTVTVTGGSLNSAASTIVKGVDGEEVYMTRVGIFYNDTKLIDKKVDTISFKGFSQDYIKDDIITDKDGFIYLWLPENSAVLDATIDGNLYEPLEEVDGEIDVTEVGILKYNSPDEHCFVNIASADYYQISLSDSISNLISGHVILNKNTLFQYYLIADNGSYTIIPYYGANTDSGKIFQMGAALEKVPGSGNVYASQAMTIAKDTQVIFNIRTTSGDSIFTLDLVNGNVNVTEGDNNTIIVEQAGYILNISKDDKLYITSDGYPTSNQLNVNLKPETSLDIYFDNINAANSEHVIKVESGIVNAEFSDDDNMLTSTGESPVVIEENGRLNIVTSGKQSIKIDGAKNNSAISGSGTLGIEDNGGFLKLNTLVTHTNTPQISVGTYVHNGLNKPSYTANIYGGEFNYDIIGYLDPDGNLKTKDQLGNDNVNDFTARGIFRVFTQVSSVSEAISGNAYVMQIKVDDSVDVLAPHVITLRNSLGNLTQIIDYTVVISADQKTATITIPASTFEAGNIIVMAASTKYIPYVSGNYEGEYDGDSHNIVLIFDDTQYDAYYSHEIILTGSNYTQGEKNNKAIFAQTNYTDTPYVVYWYLIAKDTSSTTIPVSGSNTIKITKATNKWDMELSCNDIALNDFTNPFADSRFGEVSYSYVRIVDKVEYPLVLNEDYKIVDGKYSFIKEGTYYVKATVEGNSNYTDLDSGYIRFKVVKIAVFTQTSRSFDQVTSTDTAMSITADGEFSIRYEFLSSTGMNLIFRNAAGAPLPTGTKITLIVFDEDRRDYYYYNYEQPVDFTESEIEIELTQFQVMGTINNTNMFAEPAAGTPSNYQVTVDFPKGGSNYLELSVILDVVADKIVTVKRNENIDATFDNEGEIESSGSNIQSTVQITSNPSGNATVLAFTINNEDGTILDLTNCDFTLFEGNNEYMPTVIGNTIFFNLGQSVIVSKEYLFTIYNIKNGNYVLTTDVRVNDANTEIEYSLGNITLNNHLAFDAITVDNKLLDKLYVRYIGNDKHLIVSTRGQSITFEFAILDVLNPSAQAANRTVTAKLYERTPNGYTEIQLPSELSYQIDGDNRITLTSPLVPTSELKIYRIVFTVDGAQAEYNLFVQSN